MGSRAQLHSILLAICPNVYFQPPEGYKRNYPCIQYDRNKISLTHANNKPYMNMKGYRVDVIDSDPDSTLPDKVAEIESCSFETHYKSNNLYHDVFNIYY